MSYCLVMALLQGSSNKQLNKFQLIIQDWWYSPYPVT